MGIMVYSLLLWVTPDIYIYIYISSTVCCMKVLGPHAATAALGGASVTNFSAGSLSRGRFRALLSVLGSGFMRELL